MIHHTNQNNNYHVTVTVFCTRSYQVDETELGVGLYGTVRKCRHRESGEWCAVKSIKKKKVTEIETLKREITILQQVKHPNIITLLDVYEDERYLHLVTELCTGGELFDRIIDKFESEEGHYAEFEAAKLIRDVVDAIKYCHTRGIVHRDLKVRNFFGIQILGKKKVHTTIQNYCTVHLIADHNHPSFIVLLMLF